MWKIVEDIRHARRSLSKRPIFASLVSGVLALGIGATTTVFSVVDQTVIRRPPFIHAERLVDVLNIRRGGGGGSGHPAEKVLGWREQRHVFERLESYGPRTFDLAVGDEPERIRGLAVSVGLFPMLGMQPSIGRAFTTGDARPGQERVAIVSERLALRRFGTAEQAVGARVVLSDEPHLIIGVMPAAFALLAGEQAWVPIDEARHLGPASNRDFFVIGRLAAGLSLANAQRLANETADALQSSTPLRGSWDVRLDEKRVAWTSASTRTAMLALGGAVLCLLALTCVSVAQLLFTRAAERTNELAVKASLGAGRARLAWESLVETAVLGALGGAAGIILSLWAVHAVAGPIASSLVSQLTAPITVDGRVLAAALLTTALTMLACGLMPALRAGQPRLDEVLRRKGRVVQRSAEHLSLVLVAGQVACSLVLVVGAVLMFRTIAQIGRVDLGFDAQQLVAMSIDLPSDRYQTRGVQHAFFERVREELRTRGVGQVAVAGHLTTYGFGYETVEATGGAELTEPLLIAANSVSDGYFETMGMRLVAGRTFAPADTSRPVVVLGRSLARRLWPSGNAVGAQLRDLNDPGSVRTVVGVVDDLDTRITSSERIAFQWFTPWTADDRPPDRAIAGRRTYSPHTLIVRTPDLTRSVQAIKAAVWAVDPGQPVERVRRATEAVGEVFAQQRFVQRLITVFAGLGLIVAGVGVLGVMWLIVVGRTSEIGIRIALGATPARVVRFILGRAGLTIVSGLIVGFAGAATLTRMLESLLVGVSPWDPVSFLGAAACMGMVGGAAAWYPVIRASRVDPAVAMRHDC